MKLTIIAATGGVGRQLLEQAVAAGHDVTAVVRNPAKLTRQVRTITADLAAGDPAALEPAIGGADAVLSGLGPHSNADAGIAAPGTRTIVAAMKATGVRRALMEDVLRDRGLDWTVLRPPRMTEKPFTGRYRTAYGQNLRGGLSVPRADVAHFMLRVLDQPQTIGQVIGIAS